MAVRAPSDAAVELRELLDTYDKRLRVLLDTLEDIKKGRLIKPEDMVIIRRIEGVKKENEDAMSRWQEPIEVNLDHLWNIFRMKATYYWVVKDFNKTAVKLEKWSRLKCFAQAMYTSNRNLFGTSTKFEVLPHTFPGEFDNHLMQIMVFLRVVEKGGHAYRQFEELLDWLSREQDSLASIRGVRQVEIGAIDDEVILASVKGLEIVDRKEIPVEIYLSLNYLVYKVPLSLRHLTKRETKLIALNMFDLETININHGTRIGHGIRVKVERRLKIESPIFGDDPKIIVTKNTRKRDRFYSTFVHLKQQ